MVKFNNGIRSWMSASFYKFGSHCANHQIRVLVICSLVITSLAYPALALYLTSKPLSHFSSKWLGLSLSDPAAINSKYIDGIEDFWAGFDCLVAQDDMRVRCAQDATVRVERLAIRSEERSGPMAQKTLLSALRVQRDIEHLLGRQSDTNSQLSCVRDEAGHCMVISPLAFWDDDEDAIRRTTDVQKYLDSRKNVTKAGIMLTSDMTVSRWSRDAGDRSSLVLSYMFHEEDCTSNTRHNEWLKLLDRIQSDNVSIQHGIGTPTLLALQYDPNSARSFSVLSTGLYLAYIAIFIYFSGSLRKMDTVHSRWGLAFTGLVEIVASTITSSSVCRIVGFSVRTVPWSFLPVVIVFVGAENMFILVDAVVKTSIALPVRERIAVGLSQAGTSNTLKVMTYNTLLGTIAGLSPPGAIREFCTFATVVLIAHWFLIHTFFVAVLSIDIQRLELSELLSQDPALQSAPHSVTKSNSKSGPEMTASARLQRWTQGRPAKNLSLMLLLMFTAVLYYLTLPPSTPSTVTDSNRDKTASSGNGLPILEFWSTINPRNHQYLHLRVESPAVLTLLSNVSKTSSPYRLHWIQNFIRQLKPLFCTVMVVLLPIFATTGLVYLLLLYLVKGKELLNSRHQKAAQDGDTWLNELDENSAFAALPRTNSTDIHILSATYDGSTVLTVSTEGEVSVWRESNGTYFHRYLDVRDHLDLSTYREREIQSATIDYSGSCLAVGSVGGTVIAWALGDDLPLESCVIAQLTFSSAVTQLVFPRDLGCIGTAPPARKVDLRRTTILVSLQDGSVVEQVIPSQSRNSFILPSSGGTYRSSILATLGCSDIWIAFFTKMGQIELQRYSGEFCQSLGSIQAGNATDLASEVRVLKAGFNNSFKLLAATATQAGVVMLWNLETRECLHIFEDVHNTIDQIRIVPQQGKVCPSCNQMKPNSVIICLSDSESIFIYQMCFSNNDIFAACSCSRIIAEASTPGRLSRRASLTKVADGRRRPAVGTTSESLAPFPVSGHGIHSRRSNTDRELRVKIDGADDRSDQTFLDIDRIKSVKSSPPSPTSPLVAIGSCRRIASFEIARGKWELQNSKLFGIRRRHAVCLKSRLRNKATRLHQNGQPTEASDACGLPTTVLRKWEYFTLDLSNMDSKLFDSTLNESRVLKASDLSSISDAKHSFDCENFDARPRLPFTRISCMSFASPGSFLAGMGNTVGLIINESARH